MFHIFNTCLKPFNFSFFFYGGINIFSTFLEFLSVTGFGFTILSTNLFPINAPVASAALSTIFWKQFLEHLVLFLQQCLIIQFCICQMDFSQMTKIHIMWHIFLFWVLQKNVWTLFTNKQFQINFDFYFEQSTILTSNVLWILSIYLFIYLIYLSIYVLIHLFIYLFIYLFIDFIHFQTWYIFSILWLVYYL